MKPTLRLAGQCAERSVALTASLARPQRVSLCPVPTVDSWRKLSPITDSLPQINGAIKVWLSSRTEHSPVSERRGAGLSQKLDICDH